QPLARTSGCHGGPKGPNPAPFVAALGIAFLAAAPGPPGRGPNPKPNSIITGTRPLASAGGVSASWISALICGDFAVSTCPTSRLVMAGMSPTVSLVVLVTCHVTVGTSFGTRP